MSIVLNNVSKKFKKKINKKEVVEFYADKDITLTANEGEILGILGPNGAGKTTLLRIIAGIMVPTEGTITVGGKTYDECSIEIKKNIAFLSGNTKLYKDMSSYELLTMFGKYYKMDDELIKARIKELTDRFDLNSFLYQRIETLSTGQLQRIGIARSCIHDPKYYIFDEATSGLDVISSKVILDFIKAEKQKGKCIIYSTHYMEEAQNICDKIALINKGKLIETGTVKEILEKTNTTNIRDAFFYLTEDNHE